MKQKINKLIRHAKIYFGVALAALVVLLLAGIFKYIPIGYSIGAVVPFVIGCIKVYQRRELEINQPGGW